jgi:hypothetical protein
MLMQATLGRPQNKATIEGGFGVFAQDIGPVVAVVHTATPEQIALDVADAVTRAFVVGRNHRRRRKDGKTPFELYRDRDTSPETIAAAVEVLRAMKDRIEQRRARDAASRDPRVVAAVEDACTRFGFADDGDLRAAVTKLSLEAVQEAIAIYVAKMRAGSLPVDAHTLRYFFGIARNCQIERELLFFEEELVEQLRRTGQIVQAYLERQAKSFTGLGIAPRLRAILDQLLSVPPAAPAAQVFWRRCLAAVAETVPLELRDSLRRFLCQRIRRYLAAPKRLRRSLVALVIHLLTPRTQLASS